MSQRAFRWWSDSRLPTSIPVSEKTHTIIVNDHGALILLAAAVEIQQIIRLENLNSGEELLCRVASLGPRFMGKTQVAVEFVMPTPGFWDNRL